MPLLARKPAPPRDTARTASVAQKAQYDVRGYGTRNSPPDCWGCRTAELRWDTPRLSLSPRDSNSTLSGLPRRNGSFVYHSL